MVYWDTCPKRLGTGFGAAEHHYSMFKMQHGRTAARLKTGGCEMSLYLCKFHIRLRNRPRPCKTRRTTRGRTSPRACPTPCGNSAPLWPRRRPGNSRSRPGRSVRSAASRRTAPRCICRDSSPRTWRWGSTPRRLAPRLRRGAWWGEKTSLDAGGRGGRTRVSAGWALVRGRGAGAGSPRADLSGVTQGSSGWMVISDEQLCFAHGLPSSISSFRCCRPFCQSAPFLEILFGSGINSGPPSRNWNRVTWCHMLSWVCFVCVRACVWMTPPPPSSRFVVTGLKSSIAMFNTDSY